MQNGSVTTCSGLFYDSGGPNSNYTNNLNYTMTIYPGTEGAMVSVNFTQFNTEPNYDYLYIYNGSSASATQIGQYSGTTSPGTVTATNAAGALTFKFTSDGSQVKTGWEATVSCEYSDHTITATANPEEGGSITGAGTYTHGETCTLSTTANEGYTFINWTEDGEVVSTETTYSFVVTSDKNIVANFEEASGTMVSQTCAFVGGWNWWAPNIDITLADFEEALQGNGIKIIDQAGHFVEYDNELGWSTNNNLVLEVGKMYMVQMANAFSTTVSGSIVDPAEHTITLDPGSNWVGFIGTQEMTLDEAFSGFTPTHLDNIKTQEGTSTYLNGRGWTGRVTSLVPGKGFIYKSKASTSQDFVYPTAN
jgi:archaellum component FlaG (FlaF/FlaG flagellin family)